MFDFKNQVSKQELVFSLTRSTHLEFIREACKKNELYIHKRYIDGPKNEKFIDMEILKVEPDPDSYFYHFDKLDKDDK